MTAGAEPSPVRLAGWGGGPRVIATIVRPHTTAEFDAILSESHRPLVVRGMGRSYGDVAQLSGGTVIDGRRRAVFSLDRDRGLIWAQGGVTLGEILRETAAAGWTLPVVPGTQHVTVGGAIACDVHGKNHAASGSFGSHVRALGLMSADGSVRTVSPDADPELFGVTVGGLGLTGVILWAQLELIPLPAASVMHVDTERVDGLDAAFAALDADGGPYRVAWLDLLARARVRGVVTRARIVPGPSTAASPPPQVTVAARLRVPPRWPRWPLRPSVVRAYNRQRFRLTPRGGHAHVETLGAYHFPLDALDAWPRLYGAAGLVQYQFVVPRGAEQAIECVIVALRASRVPCYLAVLKDMGHPAAAPLSFPMRGWTLALDLPRSAPDLEILLEVFDRIVIDHGGRVYLAKDGRLTAAKVAAMYPRLAAWKAIRDQVDPDHRWQSDLARRAGLVG